MPVPPRITRVTADRRHTIRGRRTVEWFFANRKWLKMSSRVVQVAIAFRPLEVGSDQAPLQFLLLVGKRDFKRAHDRNKVKRWLRAAIADAVGFAAIEEDLQAVRIQLLVMLRVSSVPDARYDAVREAVFQAASDMTGRLARYRERELNAVAQASESA